MKRLHVLSITFLAGLIMGAAIPAKAATPVKDDVSYICKDDAGTVYNTTAKIKKLEFMGLVVNGVEYLDNSDVRRSLLPNGDKLLAIRGFGSTQIAMLAMSKTMGVDLIVIDRLSDETVIMAHCENAK